MGRRVPDSEDEAKGTLEDPLGAPSPGQGAPAGAGSGVVPEEPHVKPTGEWGRGAGEQGKGRGMRQQFGCSLGGPAACSEWAGYLRY